MVKIIYKIESDGRATNLRYGDDAYILKEGEILAIVDGDKLPDISTLTLANAKAKKTADIEASLKTAMEQGFVYNTKTYKCDWESLNQLNALYNYAKTKPLVSVQVMDAKNNLITMTFLEFEAFVLAMGDHVNGGLYANRNVRIGQIQAATTIDEVNAIVW